MNGLLGCVALCPPGIILIGQSNGSEVEGWLFKISDVMLPWVVWGSNEGIVGFCWLQLFEIMHSLIMSLQGKPPAVQSQSLMSDISDGVIIDSSPARWPAYDVVSLFRVGLLVTGFEDGFDNLNLCCCRK